MRRAWKPGRGYRTAIRNTSWWRNNHDGTITAVVALTIWPEITDLAEDEDYFDRARPAYELWTVRLPLGADDPVRAPSWMPDRIGRFRLMPRRYRNGWLQPGPIYMLCDKPHRVTWWAEDDPRREVLDRGPVPAKLAACIAADDKLWRRSLLRTNCYIGPVRVPRLVYDAWRVAFRVGWKP